jgi:hypothetical protein
MDDRTLFNRFHEAFDIQPRPGSYDRMRIALTAPPVVLKRRPGIRLRFTKMGFRVAAALAVAVLVIVAVVAFLTLHRPTTGYVPANTGQDILKPYQTLTARGYFAQFMAQTNHCYSFTDTACPAATERFNAALQSWLDELSSTKAPPEFTRVDAMLRAHLAQSVFDGNTTVAAQKAGNAPLFEAAAAAHLDVRPFSDATSAAIAGARPTSAGDYRSNVTDQLDLFNSCTPCGPYAGRDQLDCAGPKIDNCVIDVVSVDAQIYNFETALVLKAAPSSLAAKDATLQTDLINADSAALVMIRAGLAGEISAFDSARASLQIAISAVKLDAAAVQS